MTPSWINSLPSFRIGMEGYCVYNGSAGNVMYPCFKIEGIDLHVVALTTTPLVIYRYNPTTDSVETATAMGGGSSIAQDVINAQGYESLRALGSVHADNMSKNDIHFKL